MRIMRGPKIKTIARALMHLTLAAGMGYAALIATTIPAQAATCDICTDGYADAYNYCLSQEYTGVGFFFCFPQADPPFTDFTCEGDQTSHWHIGYCDFCC